MANEIYRYGGESTGPRESGEPFHEGHAYGQSGHKMTPDERRALSSENMAHAVSSLSKDIARLVGVMAAHQQKG